MATRSHRLLGLLVTGFLVCLSIVLLESPSSFSEAGQQFSQLLERQSRTLSDAVREYRRRYNMHPPPHFDKWFEFARSKGVELIDEYDTIYHTLLPFWTLTPQTIRARAREALGYDNGLFGVLIRNGKVSLAEGLDGGHEWQREATLGMLKNFVRYLPDMDLVFNAHDEPRVIVPSEDLQRLVAIAKDSAVPNAFKAKSLVNEWSARPEDINKGDRIDELRTTRFNKISHQPAWTSSRISCPVDSPVRSLEENPPDDTSGYAFGKLGFIHNTTAFSDVCSTPSLRYTYGFFDRPNMFAVVHDLFPVFSQSKLSTFQDILYPSPWYWANKVPYIMQKDYDWEEKIDKLYWRGSTTGGFSKGGGWRRHHRQLMVSNINAPDNAKILVKTDGGQWEAKVIDHSTYRNLFDVRFTSVGQCDRNDCAAQMEFFNITEPVEQEEAWSYKYLIDIDGNAFSGRYHAFLKSNSLVCKAALFREWHDERLKPWVHYVPLSLKGYELVETMRYFSSEEEARHFRAIGLTSGQQARNRLWDLSNRWSVFAHQIHTLRSGFKFHYVSNKINVADSASRPLVIFIHGFPDSWGIWRHILMEESLQNSATLVAVDLPGYGGSGSLDRYSATAVLENLTEFIIAIRTKYGIDSPTATRRQRTIIVGHDWGCVLAMRLAADAPQLADRFILTNGPLIPLVLSNIGCRVSSSVKMLKSILRSPIQKRSLLFNTAKSLKPVFFQLWLSGYIFAFQLPPLLLDYIGSGANQATLKYIHKMSYGKQSYTLTDAAECMASTLGPSIHEGRTQTADGEGYADSAVTRPAISNFAEMCSYYRDGTATASWGKSIETITSLHSISRENGSRHTDRDAGGLYDRPSGALKASTTVVWGLKDHALTRELCLDGISDYLPQDSQVIELPVSGHWTPLEREGRIALGKVVEWAVKGEREGIGAVIEACYPKATTVYDQLIPVYRMTNHTPANLWLMERPDLIAAFTKIELWRQTQFKRIVYIDSDVVAIRAPDELLDLDVDFAAVPDVGWPDCFNSGVMVLRPNMQDYFALKALAERGISFDGADQGLLNMHFLDWHRLSFTYNCTPSANYQYVPAYKHFQSTISLIHFIGSQKPWNMSRQVAPFDSPYNQLLGRWWTIYDRHYHSVTIETIEPSSRPVPPQVCHFDEPISNMHVQYFPDTVPPEHIEQQTPFIPVPDTMSHHQLPKHDVPSDQQPNYRPPESASHDTVQAAHYSESSRAPLPAGRPSHSIQAKHHIEKPLHEPAISVVPQYVRGEEHVRAYIQQQPYQELAQPFLQPPSIHEPTAPTEPAHPSEQYDSHTPQLPAPIGTQQASSPQSPPQEEPIFEAPKAEWDASREPPPLNSKPEGIALESKTYTMSDDNQLFQPPETYPEAPKNMYYQVPKTKPEPQKLRQIFPWEANAPKPTRVFADDARQPEPTVSPTSAEEDSRTPKSSQPSSWRSEGPSLPSQSFDSYSRSNAWDEVPEIQKYVQSIQQARKARVQVLSGGPSHQKATSPTSSQQHQSSTTTTTTSFKSPSRGTRITDFPSELDRPSLPVTPAPIHRGPALGSPDEYITPQLPAANGVPNQEDWVRLTVDNPSVRLEELRRRHNSVLESPDSLVERLTRALEDESEDGAGPN
ncbi:hypothetical protein BDW66DRAFT_167897 [Aspergillus desertorum]